MEIMKVEDLVRNYRKSILKENENDVKVLKKISFDVYKGEFVGIMGKSGCGKTTLLKTLGMIDKPNEGKIYFMGEDTSGFCGDKLADIRNKKIGFIFQDFYLMDSLSIEENIMLPMLIGKKKIQGIRKLVSEYAEQFQISHLLNKNPYELSGGEKQRVAICRALINNPDLILADEPTGNLDSKSGKIVIDALNKISLKYHKTIVMVTHDPQMASYCNRIILLKDGKILEEIKKRKSMNIELYQKYFRKNNKGLVLLILIIGVGTVVNGLNPYIYGKIIDSISGKNIIILKKWLLCLGIVLIVTLILETVESLIGNWLTNIIENQIKNDLFAHITIMECKNLDIYEEGELFQV